MLFFLFLFFIQLIAQDYSFNNKFYFLEECGAHYRSDCFFLRSNDFVLFHKRLHDDEILKGLPFLKKTNILEKILTKRATKHFSFFYNFFPKNFYQILYHYFSLDTGNDTLNKDKLLVWQCFFDYKKENNFLLDSFVFDEKRRNEKKNVYDKRLRSTLLGREFLEFFEDAYPGSLSYVNAEGNCDGLALYSFLDCLYRKKIFDDRHIITLGSIKKNGDIGRVGRSFNKFFIG